MTTSPSMLPKGFRAAGMAAGIKKNGNPDLALLLADHPAPAAAMFTRNQLNGAHIALCREHLRMGGGRVRAVLVNAGNANCATGARGLDDARRLCTSLARLIGCDTSHVLMMSTGVIGAHLPVARIENALPALLAECDTDGFERFAEAIRTTDTVRKIATHDDPQGRFRIVGAAKGSGMIHPDMATMFGFLLTDASIVEPPGCPLAQVVDASFHRLSVDGDTSPNDTVLLWGLGEATAPPDELRQALTAVGRELAMRIARDGEGATRLVTVQVREARSESEATQVARTIATSPLVKTAIYGRDPNWGRILSAAARAGVPFSVGAARVWIGDAVVYRNGVPDPSAEPAAHDHLANHAEVVIGVSLGAGSASVEAWTCDYSPAYVTINADYRS